MAPRPGSSSAARIAAPVGFAAPDSLDRLRRGAAPPRRAGRPGTAAASGRGSEGTGRRRRVGVSRPSWFFSARAGDREGLVRVVEGRRLGRRRGGRRAVARRPRVVEFRRRRRRRDGDEVLAPVDDLGDARRALQRYVELLRPSPAVVSVGQPVFHDLHLWRRRGGQGQRRECYDQRTEAHSCSVGEDELNRALGAFAEFIRITCSAPDGFESRRRLGPLH